MFSCTKDFQFESVDGRLRSAHCQAGILCNITYYGGLTGVLACGWPKGQWGGSGLWVEAGRKAGVTFYITLTFESHYLLYYTLGMVLYNI